ncbi:MAG: ThuA domain-containing protein [Thermofilaceae archaeon]
MERRIRVTVWGEFIQERTEEAVTRVYPRGIHEAIAEHLRQMPGLIVRTATLEQPEHGLSDEVLRETDVLVWWGHVAHDKVRDEVVERVYRRVLEGMGLVILHSAHYSKIFRRLMGTSCSLKWREAGEKERIWVVAPWHPIAEGLPEYFELEHEEMYGEYFDIPPPDELVFISWFEGGEVFRSGCCFYRGRGRIFYFRPGHETYPTFYNHHVRRVIYNAVRWAAPTSGPAPRYGNVQALEPIGRSNR